MAAEVRVGTVVRLRSVRSFFQLHCGQGGLTEPVVLLRETNKGSQWLVEQGKGKSFMFKNIASGLYLHVPDEAKGNKKPIVSWNSTTEGSCWLIEGSPDKKPDVIMLKSVRSKKYCHVRDEAKKEMDAVVQWYSTTDGSQWVIELLQPGQDDDRPAATENRKTDAVPTSSVSGSFLSLTSNGEVASRLKTMGSYAQRFPVHNGPGTFEIMTDTRDLPAGATCTAAFRYRKEKQGGAPFQWIGWQEPGFEGKHVQMSFWIKFLQKLPRAGPGCFSVKLYGEDCWGFMDEIQADQWFHVKCVRKNMPKDGDFHHCIFITDGMQDPIQFLLADLRLDIMDQDPMPEPNMRWIVKSEDVLKDEDLADLGKLVDAKGGKEFRVSRVFILGQGRVGKTALYRAMLGQPFEETDSTVGAVEGIFEVQGSDVLGKSWEGYNRLENRAYDEALAREAAKALVSKDKNLSAEGVVKNTDLTSQGQILDVLRQHHTISPSAVEPNLSNTQENPEIMVGVDGATTGGSLDIIQTSPPNSDPTDPKQISSLPATSVASSNFAEESSAPSQTGIQRLDKDLVLKFRAAKDSKEPLKLSVWDFGGQENFYALHLLFLSRYGVYLVPFNMLRLSSKATREEKEKSILYIRFWLQCVATYTAIEGGSGAPVILVGTHKDHISDPKEHEGISQLLYQEFSTSPVWTTIQPYKQGEVSTGRGLLWFFPVNCMAGQGDPVVVHLMSQIESVIEQEDYIKKQVPFAWMAMYDELQIQNRTVMTLNEVQQMAKKMGLGSQMKIDEEVGFMLRFFSGLGVISYHEEAALRDIVILNPTTFLIEPACKVICAFDIHVISEHEEARKALPREFRMLTNYGILSRKLLPYLWQKFSHLAEIENVMVKYGLMVPLLVEDSSETVDDDLLYLVPSVLPSRSVQSSTPATLTAFLVFAPRNTMMKDWSSCLSMSDVAREGFYPIGLFHRIVCKAVSWMQMVDGTRVRDLKDYLSQNHAQLSFGIHRFTMVLSESQGCIRVEIHIAQPLEVLHQVREFAEQAIMECAPGLACSFAVPEDGGCLGPYDNYQEQIVLLDKPQGLIAAVEDGKGLSLRTGFKTSEELHHLFDPWMLPRGLKDEYHVFISYRRVGFDKDLAGALFQSLSRAVVNSSSSPVVVFLDQYRLEDGRNYRRDFATALIHTKIAVPIISVAALQRMKTVRAVGGPFDNVLLEWTLILELIANGVLHRCFPVLLGQVTADDETAAVTSLFKEPDLQQLPRVVCGQISAEIESILSELSIPVSSKLHSRTVFDTVQELLQLQGLPGWSAQSRHGRDAPSSHRKNDCRGLLVRQCVSSITNMLGSSVPDGVGVPVELVPSARPCETTGSAEPLPPQKRQSAGQNVNKELELERMRMEHELQLKKIELDNKAKMEHEIEMKKMELEKERLKLEQAKIEASVKEQQNANPVHQATPAGSGCCCIQ